MINTVGGIDINVLHPITDDAYPDDTGKGATDPYAYKRLYIAPGPQHLDGLTALEYVRSRHADLVGDFGRSVRQQQILSQLKYKLDNPSVLGELPQLAQDLDGYVKTDMQLQDVFNLLYFAKSLNQSQIGQYTLGPPYSTTAKSTHPRVCRASSSWIARESYRSSIKSSLSAVRQPANRWMPTIQWPPPALRWPRRLAALQRRLKCQPRPPAHHGKRPRSAR